MKQTRPTPHTESRSTDIHIIVFAITIFVGAFLLFQVQPIIGKYILPWFGGSPSVWTACLLFFQIFLLLGYLYAHILSSKFTLSVQVIIHALLLIGSLTVLPIIPSDSWRPSGDDDPTWQILQLLAGTIGLPYLALSATGPLVQRWFAAANPGVSPYRLYALSNLASMLALLSYPFIIEPLIARSSQATIWSWGMIGFVLSCSFTGFVVWRIGSKTKSKQRESLSATTTDLRTRILWVALPATASVLLLATTNKICQELVVVPFLWILPLVLYLLSFVVAFDKSKWYSRPIFGGLLVVGLTLIAWITLQRDDLPILLPLATYSAVLFIACMVMHGEVVRLKPSPESLTSFYLSISLGGAIGGVFVAIIAPFIFDEYLEFPLALLLSGFLALVVFFTDKESKLYRGKPEWAWGLMLLALFGFGFTQQEGRSRSRENTIVNERNFYGTLTIAEYEPDKPKAVHRTMRHGRILHGLQYMHRELAAMPTAYFTPKGGVGLLLTYFPEAGRRVGVVGLGIGTLAAWGMPGDYFRFYEIDPDVKRLADQYFTYLKNCPATISYVLGDARLMMEAEEPQYFDILILDAFNNDSPPVHLLTREAFQIYRKHLKPDGAIAINITSKYINFFPVVAQLAEDANFQWAYVFDPNTEDEFYRTASAWMLLTNNPALMREEAIIRASTIPNVPYRELPIWTDDYTSLYPIVDW